MLLLRQTENKQQSNLPGTIQVNPAHQSRMNQQMTLNRFALFLCSSLSMFSAGFYVGNIVSRKLSFHRAPMK